MTSNRRRFLSMAAGGIPFALAGLAFGSTAARAATCYDPELLPRSQKNRRRGLGFEEQSPDPARECRGCAFFTPGEEDGCGECMMLDYTVSASGTCTSFTPRPE
jgi:hypothetical protein